MTAADDALDAISNISVQQIRSELETLRAVNAWAINSLNLGYQPGDKVVIVSDEPSSVKPSSGWYPHRESLRPGRIGTVRGINYNRSHDVWQADVALDCGVFFLDVSYVRKASEQR